MASKLSTIIDWAMGKAYDAGDNHNIAEINKVHHTALKHLEALLKAEYQRGRMDAIENHTLDGKPL